MALASDTARDVLIGDHKLLRDTSITVFGKQMPLWKLGELVLRASAIDLLLPTAEEHKRKPFGGLKPDRQEKRLQQGLWVWPQCGGARSPR